MMRRFRRPFINAVPMTAAQIEVMSKANALAASQQFGQRGLGFGEAIPQEVDPGLQS